MTDEQWTLKEKKKKGQERKRSEEGRTKELSKKRRIRTTTSTLGRMATFYTIDTLPLPANMQASNTTGRRRSRAHLIIIFRHSTSLQLNRFFVYSGAIHL